MKKLMTVFLALAMVLSLSLAALAGEPPADDAASSEGASSGEVAFDASMVEVPYELVQLSVYQVQKVAEGIYNISDANYQFANNYNNGSDMYVILGEDKAFMVDLGNDYIDGFENDGLAPNPQAAIELDSIVKALIGERELEIGITHAHPDHDGMTMLFADQGITIYLPETEDLDAPMQQHGIDTAVYTLFTPEEMTFDIGGRTISTILVKGHSQGSAVYLLNEENGTYLFSGDSIGSGLGCFCFTADSLKLQEEGTANLYEKLMETLAPFERYRMKVFTGHAWQNAFGGYLRFSLPSYDIGGLDWRYVQDSYYCAQGVVNGDWLKEGSRIQFLPWSLDPESPDFHMMANPNYTGGDMVYGTSGIATSLEAAMEAAALSTAESAPAKDTADLTPEEKYNLAMEYQMKGDMANGFPLLMQAGEEGYAQAQYILGEFNQSGDFAEPNYEEALRWDELAVAQDHARAKVNLGILYMNGWAVEQDYAKAMELFREASEQEDSKAPRYVGILYENGYGVEPDVEAAFQWYQLGVERDDLTSKYLLGSLYERGEGAEQDYAKAMELYLASAGRDDHVSAPSQLAVGLLYLNGLGVEQDLVQAREWIRRAAANGSEEAAEILGTFTSDVQISVESTLHGSAFTYGKSTLKAEYGEDVTYDEDGAAIITLTLPDGTAIDDSKIDSSHAVVTMLDGDAYYASEFIFAPTALNGTWENGTCTYTLQEGDITWYTADYAIDNGGREWTCLAIDGEGHYVFNLQVDGILYDGKLVDSQTFRADVQIYGCDYSDDAYIAPSLEAVFAPLREKAGDEQVPEVGERPVWTWIGDGEKPVLCDEKTDDFYISWPDGMDASSLAAEDVQITLYSLYGDTLILTADQDYQVASSEWETQIAVTFLNLPASPVYATMTIDIPSMEAKQTYDIASVYLNVIQSGGGMDRDNTVVCYRFVGLANFTDYHQVLPPMTYTLSVDTTEGTRYYAEDASGNAYLAAASGEALVFDAEGSADKNAQLIGQTVFTTNRVNAQEEKTVDGEAMVFTKQYIDGWPSYQGMEPLPGYIIGFGIEHQKWAWAEGIATGWRALPVTPAGVHDGFTMQRGTEQQFAVEGHDVTWSLTPNASAGTTISDDGILHVAADEPADYIAIKATDTDGNMGSVAIILTDEEVPEEVNIPQTAGGSSSGDSGDGESADGASGGESADGESGGESAGESADGESDGESRGE